MFDPAGLNDVPGPAEMAAMPDSAAETHIAGYQAGFGWLRDPRWVTVAAVQGHAIGAGFQLALACDLRLVADDVRFCMAEVTLGLVPDLGGTYPLVHAVGYARAVEICLSARRVGAAEAVSIGLASRSVPVAELDTAVDELSAASPPRRPAPRRRRWPCCPPSRTAPSRPTHWRRSGPPRCGGSAPWSPARANQRADGRAGPTGERAPHRCTCRAYLPRQVALVVPSSSDKSSGGRGCLGSLTGTARRRPARLWRAELAASSG